MYDPNKSTLRMVYMKKLQYIQVVNHKLPISLPPFCGAPLAKGSSTKNNQILTNINKKSVSHQCLINQKSMSHYIKKISTVHIQKICKK